MSKKRLIDKPFVATLELRFLRQTHYVSTAPSDIMQVVIGKQYPTQAVQKCTLQQKWTNGTVDEWHDVEIVDDQQTVPVPPNNFVADTLKRRQLIQENIRQNMEFSEKIRKEKLKRRGR